MKIIVCDASPLIFLAKLDLLSLIPDLLCGKVYLLQCVLDEIRSEKASPVELRRIETFLTQAEIVQFDADPIRSSALSRSDQSTLQWAVHQQVDWLVADEKLLRSIAIAEGLAVTGFLGLIVFAARTGRLSGAASREALRLAVSLHGCRISAALYQRVLSELDKI